MYWLELLIDAEIVTRGRLEELITEGNEIVAMVVTSIRTSRKNEGHTNAD